MIPNKEYSVGIIGAGPAGLSVAIQLKRIGINGVVFAEHFGGTVRNAILLENLLGYPGGISGPAWVDQVRIQYEGWNIPLIKTRVNRVVANQNGYEIHTDSQIVSCSRVVIATGTIPNTLGIGGEDDLVLQNRSYYDMWQFRESQQAGIIPDVSALTAVVIGGGDVAYDYALNLAESFQEVIILQRSADSVALSLLQNRVGGSSKIKVIKPLSPTELTILRDGNGNKNRIIIKAIYSGNDHESPTEGEKTEIIADILFVAIGRLPNLQCLSKNLLPSVTPSDLTPSSQSLFFIGDVAHPSERQVALAMGDGLRVAMAIKRAENLLKTGKKN